jgi:hypothetical protein
VPAVVKTACSGTISVGGVFLTRFFTSYSGTAPTNADLQEFDADVGEAIDSNIKALTNNAYTFTQVESIDLTSPTAAIDTSAVSVQGTNSGTYISAQACMVVSYEIARRYRGGHPRGYWTPGATEELENPRFWETDYQAAYQSAIDSFFTSVAASGWSGAGTLTHVNVSYFAGFTVVTSPTTGRARNVPTPRVTPVVDPVTSTIARSTVGTQRRREHFID